MKTNKKINILALFLAINVIFFGIANAAKASDEYEYYSGGYDTVYDYDYGYDAGYGDYGYDAGYGNGYDYDAGYGNGYDYDAGYGNGYDYDAGYGNGYDYDAGYGNGYDYDAGYGNGYDYDAGYGNGYDYDAGYGNGYGYDAGYGNGYDYDAGYGNGYDYDAGYGNGYDYDAGYGNGYSYNGAGYGNNSYNSGSNYGCGSYCGSNYTQPSRYSALPARYQPSPTYPHSTCGSSYNCGYTPSCGYSYNCGSTPPIYNTQPVYPQPSYTSPSNFNSNYYSPTNTSNPTNTNTFNPTNTNSFNPKNDNTNANLNVNDPITISNALSSSSVNNVFNPTFNPTNSINNPINIVVNVPHGQNATQNSNITAYCVAIPSNPQTGTTVTWQANASGGNGNYTYSWSGDVFGGGQTVTNTYYSPGNKNAVVTVNSNGQQATASCSTYVQPYGSTISNVSVYQQPQAPYGNPSAGVYLSQIPATGITPGLKMTLFALGLFMWSAFGAYMILAKRKMALVVAGMDGVIMEDETVEDEADESITSINEDPSEALENDLSFRARENNVLISRDGISAIMNRAGNNAVAAEAMLTSVISKVARNEGDYATLNGDKINSILNS